jgi:hypothetical protein
MPMLNHRIYGRQMSASMRRLFFLRYDDGGVLGQSTGSQGIERQTSEVRSLRCVSSSASETCPHFEVNRRAPMKSTKALTLGDK